MNQQETDNSPKEFNEEPSIKDAVGFAFFFPTIIFLAFVAIFLHKFFDLNPALIIGLLYWVFVLYEYKFEFVMHSKFSIKGFTYKSENAEKYKLHLGFHILIAIAFTVTGIVFQILEKG